MNAHIESFGDAPDFEGAKCEALVCEEYFHKGQLSSAANVVWLKLNGRWHRFFFDCGVLNWRRSETSPKAYSMSELEGDVRLADIGERFGLIGCPVEKEEELEEPTARLTLRFGGAGCIVFSHAGDQTSYEKRA